ncbi:MAG: 30S ribosomal protein S3 [Candidatus Gracilibacteria bacterium]|nr:30S ribosomal protein S3 [Candidatus Gracilibacteria bacterium]
MGHKVSPLAFRIGYIKSWRSTGFYSKKDYSANVSTDMQVRLHINKFLKGIPVANVFLSHSNQTITVTIYTARIAIVLGKDDENVNRLKTELSTKFGLTFQIEVKEVKKPELSAALVADSIARQIEKKMPYRRVIKNAISRTMEKGGLGIKVIISGRVNGAEIARTETYKEGSIPSLTIRSDIDYAIERAQTVAGTIGLKIWVYKGDVFKK